MTFFSARPDVPSPDLPDSPSDKSSRRLPRSSGARTRNVHRTHLFLRPHNLINPDEISEKNHMGLTAPLLITAIPMDRQMSGHGKWRTCHLEVEFI